MSPTQRSLKHLRGKGYTVAITEHWCPFSKRRKDLFNFIDLVAIRVGERGVTAIQTTSGTNVSHRMDKIRGCPEAAIWLASGNSILVHGWRKAGDRGKRKTWQLREEPFSV